MHFFYVKLIYFLNFAMLDLEFKVFSMLLDFSKVTV